MSVPYRISQSSGPHSFSIILRSEDSFQFQNRLIRNDVTEQDATLISVEVLDPTVRNSKSYGSFRKDWPVHRVIKGRKYTVDPEWPYDPMTLNDPR